MTHRRTAITATATAAMAVALGLAASSLPAATTTAPLPFRIEHDRAVIAGWDDAPVTTHVEFLRLAPESFSTSSVYMRRLRLTRGRVESAPFEMPKGATRLRMAAAGEPVENEFPRIRVSLVPADAASTTPEAVVFDSFVASLMLQNYYISVPEVFRGKPCRVAIEMTNPSSLFDTRMLRLAYIALEREEIRPRQ